MISIRLKKLLVTKNYNSTPTIILILTFRKVSQAVWASTDAFLETAVLFPRAAMAPVGAPFLVTGAIRSRDLDVVIPLRVLTVDAVSGKIYIDRRRVRSVP